MALRYLSRMLSVVLFFSVLLMIGPSKAAACSCAPPPAMKEDLQMKTAVFAGKVMSIGTHAGSVLRSSSAPVKVQLQVYRVWKGDLTAETVIYTPRDSASCGYEGFAVGSEFLVFATGSAERLETNLCTRTKPLATAQGDLAALGDGYGPNGAGPPAGTREEASGAGGMTGASAKALWSLGIILAGTVLLARLHKRRRL